jgi:hypothetical protein
MPARMRYESHGIVETTATWPRQRNVSQQYARTNSDQEGDFVHVELGEERTVQPSEQHSWRNRIL